MNMAMLLAQQNNSPLPTWPLFLILGLFFYFMILAPDRKRRAQTAQMLADLKKNDQIVTAGGIYGTVVNVYPDAVVLRVDESTNTRLRVQRNSIARVLVEGEASSTEG